MISSGSWWIERPGHSRREPLLCLRQREHGGSLPSRHPCSMNGHPEVLIHRRKRRRHATVAAAAGRPAAW
jgi:hypothetical protein